MIAASRSGRVPPTAARAIVAGAILLALVCAWPARARAGHRVEADPHQMYEEARDAVAHGDLKTARATLVRLRDLVAKRPDWDPDGVFSRELLPPIEGRLNRLLETGRRLDEFAQRSLRTLRPPDLKQDISTVRDYTDWATSVIRRLRDERDQIIASSLPDPEDQAILAHTESYARTERLLEVDVLNRMAAAAGDDILGLLAGDPKLESVLVRFRQLKRDLMEAMAAKTALEKQLKTSEARDLARLGLIGLLATDGGDAATAGARPAEVADLFPRFLDARQAGLQSAERVTPGEREALHADLERWARTNRLLTAAGLAQDQGPRIAALAKVIDALPAGSAGGGAAPPLGAGALACVAALVAGGGFAGGIAWARRRRRAGTARFGDHTVPLHARPLGAAAPGADSETIDADDRRKAV